MTANPPDLRPDLAQARLAETPRPGQPTIGMVSLGCPKALVDSERILTRLRAEGYGISPDYAGADAVIVNTCGFLDSAKAESLEAIGEALDASDGDRAFELMHDLLDGVWATLPRVVRPGGIVVVNVGPATRTLDDFQQYPNHEAVTRRLRAHGFQSLPGVL